MPPLRQLCACNGHSRAALDGHSSTDADGRGRSMGGSATRGYGMGLNPSQLNFATMTRGNVESRPHRSTRINCAGAALTQRRRKPQVFESGNPRRRAATQQWWQTRHPRVRWTGLVCRRQFSEWTDFRWIDLAHRRPLLIDTAVRGRFGRA